MFDIGVKYFKHIISVEIHKKLCLAFLASMKFLFLRKKSHIVPTERKIYQPGLFFVLKVSNIKFFFFYIFVYDLPLDLLVRSGTLELHN
jgi:hypothetical protein